MKHLFIINPSAGKKKSTRLLEERIRKLDEPYEIALTQRTGDARRIAREAAERGEPVRIYAPSTRWSTVRRVLTTPPSPMCPSAQATTF